MKDEIVMSLIGPDEIIGLEEIMMGYEKNCKTMTSKSIVGELYFIPMEEIVKTVFNANSISIIKSQALQKQAQLTNQLERIARVKND